MSRRLFGPLALAVLLAAAPAPAADKDTAPISVQVTSALAGEKGFGRIMSSASTGDVEDTASDLEGQLRKFPFLQLVGRDPEVTVLVDRRSRTETSRTTNKKGEVTINHRYTASATVAIGDGERDRVEADTTYSQGPSATRDDSSHFDTVAKELANNISSRILQSLDRLRPHRPQAGFAHKTKYKMLFRGDGLEVLSVEPGSPAEEAGLQVGDRIRAIDGEKGTDQMHTKVLSWWTDLPGARYTLEVERNKQRRPVQISLLPPARWGGRSARPAPAAAAAAPSRPAATREPAAAPSRPAAAASGSVSSSGGSGVELKPGMTQAQVVRALGEPQKKVAFGAKVIWTYDGFTVTFVDGKVTDVK